MPKYSLTEPTSPTAVVVGTINRVKRVAARMDDDDTPWFLNHYHDNGDDGGWHSWGPLLDRFDADPRIVNVATPHGLTDEQVWVLDEVNTALRSHDLHIDGVPADYTLRAAFPEAFAPEPGLYEKYRVARIDGQPVGECFVLETDDPATAPAMRAYAAATDKEEFAADLRERFGVTDQLTALTKEQCEAIRVAERKLGPSLEAGGLCAAFPEVFAPEPESGADIPEEVVDAAASAYAEGYDEYTYSTLDRDRKAFRAALAAADAKRAELEGGNDVPR